MGLYRECPQKYKFRYIHKLPEKPKYYFAFGSAMHSVMEYIYGVEKPPFPTLKQALDFFERNWNASSFDEKGYASMDKEYDGYLEGQRIIKEYYAKNEKDFFVPLSVEMRSTLDIDGLSLISILDRLDYLGDGRVGILDYKTGKTVQREPDQLMMYQKVVENSPAVKQMVQAFDPKAKEVRVEKMTFYHLPKLMEMSFERAPDSEIDVFWKGVLKTADDIRAEIYTPNPSETACRFCDYKDFCPVFTGKEFTGFNAVQSPAPKAVQKLLSPEEMLSSQIDEYGEMIDKAKKLKKDIITSMRSMGFNKHFGSKFQASLQESTQLEFADKEAVVEELKKDGLLQKTLVPTMSTVCGLLTDSSVSAETKDKLKSMSKEVKKTDITITKVDE
ncbi:RecB family exonuclease [Parelusimicrobium proximum]